MYHSPSGPRFMCPRGVPPGVVTAPLRSLSGPNHSTQGTTSLGCLGKTSRVPAKYLTPGLRTQGESLVRCVRRFR